MAKHCVTEEVLLQHKKCHDPSTVKDGIFGLLIMSKIFYYASLFVVTSSRLT